MNFDLLIGKPLYSVKEYGELMLLSLMPNGNGYDLFPHASTHWAYSMRNKPVATGLTAEAIAEALNPLTQGELRLATPFVCLVDDDGDMIPATMLAYSGKGCVYLTTMGNCWISIAKSTWEALTLGDEVSHGFIANFWEGQPILEGSALDDETAMRIRSLQLISPLPTQDGFEDVSGEAWEHFMRSGELPMSAAQMSMQDKLGLVYRLACNLAFDGIGAIDTTALYGEDFSDLIWGYAEGLYQQRIDKLVNGECSIQASLDFDMEAEEKLIDSHIDMLFELDKKVPAIA